MNLRMAEVVVGRRVCASMRTSACGRRCEDSAALVSIVCPHKYGNAASVEYLSFKPAVGMEANIIVQRAARFMRTT